MTDARRALLVGIDHYDHVTPLAGCISDARGLEALLALNHDGSPNFSCQLKTSDAGGITRTALMERIEALFAPEADVALLYFSGHGTRNDLDTYLVTSDADKYDEGVGLSNVLTLANKSPVSEKIIILDSCRSGGAGVAPVTGNTFAQMSEGISILTASRSSQNAVEVAGHGLFTSLLIAALDGGAADTIGKVTVPAVYSYIDESLGPWDQRPMFKSHVAKLVTLREARPAIALGTLRQFKDWFPTADATYPLDPSYEPTVEPNDAAHETIFAELQKCRAARLVDPVDEEHMYFAAMHSTGCVLTPLGQHYWRRAKDGNI